MVHQIVELAAVERTGKGWHLAGPGIGISRLPDTMRQRIVDRLEIAAPQPVVVIQVGIAKFLTAAGSRAVTLHAIDAECCGTASHRLLHQFAVFL